MTSSSLRWHCRVSVRCEVEHVLYLAFVPERPPSDGGRWLVDGREPVHGRPGGRGYSARPGVADSVVVDLVVGCLLKHACGDCLTLLLDALDKIAARGRDWLRHTDSMIKQETDPVQFGFDVFGRMTVGSIARSAPHRYARSRRSRSSNAG